MEIKRLVVPKEIKLQKRIMYEIWFLMEGYNVWHKHCECFELETAERHARDLESKCKCFIEIRKIDKSEKIYRFYDYYTSEE